MKLTTRCKSCKTEINFNSSVNDRVELEMAKGKVFPFTCKECTRKDKYHVNDFTAEKSKSHAIFLFSVIIGLILALVLSEIFVEVFS